MSGYARGAADSPISIPLVIAVSTVIHIISFVRDPISYFNGACNLLSLLRE